jgi:predicted ATP-binding protein involved in virulence
MRIEQLNLKNFCSFGDLKISFPESNLAVFIGNNGAGKTTILKSLALSLSWLVARIKRERGSGSPIEDLDILNGTNATQISLAVKEQDKTFQWTLAKTAEGKKSKYESALTESSKLADIYRTQFTENNESSFPLIIYYPVERTVLDVPLKIKTRHKFEQLDGYDNALSQKSVDFRRFFEWFRDREDAENETKNNWNSEIQKYYIDNPDADLGKFFELDKGHLYKDIQLTAVRDAITLCMPSFDNLRIQRKPRLKMLVDKGGYYNTLNVLQLSQGEKSLLALTGDIARRLAIMNPQLDNPLMGNGIVLIDEIDMHLHPQWQREVLPALQKTFPNIQFIVTTHSPQVLSRVHKDDIFILKDNQLYQPSSNPIGRDSSDILDEIMDITKRPDDIQKLSDDYFLLLAKNELEEANKIRIELDKLVEDKKLDKDDPLFYRANGILARKQLLKK